MADTVLTLAQIENLFQSLTSQILGTSDPSAVRIGWSSDGAPGWEISQDVCFIFVRYDDNPYTRQMQTDYSQFDANNANSNLVYTAGVRVSWNVYGPNSFEHSDLIRANLFTDATTTQLAANNLALVTDVAMPIRVPELFDGQWWNRSTLNAEFNEHVIRQTTVPYIQTAVLNTQEG